MDMAIADRIRRTLTDRHVRLVVDLTAVGYIDSSAMGAVGVALEHARSRGGDLGLAALQDNVRALFVLTHLHKAVAIEPTRQAVASW